MLKRLIVQHRWRLFGFLLASLLLHACEPAAPQLTPLATDARVLAFGDSLTYGSGAIREHSYPAELARLSGLELINAGVPGEVSAAGLQRLPALLRQHQPSLLILCHGGNDILRRMPLADTAQHLQAMIDLARNAGVEVVLIAVPRPGLLLSSADFYTALAERNQIPIENNILASILRQSALKSDQIHPNAAGYAMLAGAVLELLIEFGALPSR